MFGKGVSNFAKGEAGAYYKNAKKNSGGLAQGVRNTYKNLTHKF